MDEKENNERIWNNILKKTNKSGKIVKSDLSYCWEWQGILKEGYGIYSKLAVHRFSYEYNYSKIPNGYCVMHKCDNRCCLNPNHLEIGTLQDNIADKVKKGRSKGGNRVGMRSNFSKLSDEDIKYIKDNENNRGERWAKELGVKFGVRFQHIYRIWNGTRRATTNTNVSDKDDFFNRAIKNKRIIDEKLGECWETERDKQIISFENKKKLSHRIAYELENGKFDEKLQVRHKCDNSKCINPTHLELGSHQDNMNDRNERGRTAKGSNHGCSTITEEIAKAIYNMKGKEVASKIAKQFNTTKNIVYNILSKKTWKCIHSSETSIIPVNEIVENK